MSIKAIAPQLRTTDIAGTLRFYKEKLGFSVDFNYENFYAGIRCGDQKVHLKQVCDQDPSISYVEEGGHLHLYLETGDATALSKELKDRGVALVKEVHETQWQTREFVIRDDQGHTLYFGEPI